MLGPKTSLHSAKTLYPMGHPLWTPVDPFVQKEVKKFEQFEHDRHAFKHPQLSDDPLLTGPYGQIGLTPPELDSKVPKAGPRVENVPPRPPVEAERKAKPTTPPPPVSPPGIARPIYTGGAPALRPDQMEQAVVDGSPILKALYALPGKLSFLRTGYMALTRVIGPVGAIAALGYNIVNAKNILRDPKAPLFLKGGIVVSTGLAGVSAVTATRLAAAAWGWAPMATGALKSMGKVCGLAGLGAGALLSAMDTFNTFRDPNATAAEKGFSSLTTVASIGLTAVVALGLTGPIGIVLGVGVIALTLCKGWFGKNPTCNKVFGAIGNAASAVGSWIGSGLSKLKFW